jgi:hypothetical protein
MRLAGAGSFTPLAVTVFSTRVFRVRVFIAGLRQTFGWEL